MDILRTLITQTVGRQTMYRQMMYFLIVHLLLAFVLAVIGVIGINPWQLVVNNIYLVVTCLIFNQLFAKLLHIAPNLESQYITAHILTLIVGPVALLPSLGFLTFLSFAAMASKYLFAPKARHIFNPAAFAVVLSAVVLQQGASWWVGQLPFLPLTVIGGWLIIDRIRRLSIVVSFLATYLGLILIQLLATGVSVADTIGSLWAILTTTAIVFFSLVMLPEPLTTPARRNYRIAYGVLIGTLLFVLQNVLSAIPYTLELALLGGNIFAWFTQMSSRYQITLLKQEKLAPHIYAFTFEKPESFSYKAGQYLEWMLPHHPEDTRGTRRYFTIASSPTEEYLLLVTKVVEQPSSFKRALLELKKGDGIMVSHLEGDFVLPLVSAKSIVLIAGGIGITPYRSMIAHAVETKSPLDVTLVYSARTDAELVFTDLFKRAEKTIGLTSHYLVQEKTGKVPSASIATIDAGWIKHNLIDYKSKAYYISGPEPMVQATVKQLHMLGIPRSEIYRDDFPGY